jgi:23S rRNA (guanosine2251-2'-O)-methyltransferase
VVPARPIAPSRPVPLVQPLPELLGPGEELVAGRRPVEEAFAARREAIRLLVVPQRRQALERLVLHATNLRIPIVEVEGGTLTALAGFDGHQGIGLVVPPRRYATLEEILARALERGEPPLVLVLDSLEDPQNVGTLLRTAEAAGVHGVIFPTRRQAPLTPAAVKASAGAVEHLLLAPVDDLPAALADLHVRGLRIAGAEADAPLTVREADLRGPLAIVVGSEGQGLGPAVRRRCDLLMRIPMRGAIGSLNAAVAGSIILFEALAQRLPPGGAEPGAPGRGEPGPPGRGEAPGPPGRGEAPGASEAPGDREPVASEAPESAEPGTPEAGPTGASGPGGLPPAGPAGGGA